MKFLNRLAGVGGESEKWEEWGHGGRGFRRLWKGPGGMTLYADPVQVDERGPFIAFEVPGQVASSIEPAHLQACFNSAPWVGRPSRLDLAADHDFFGPAEVAGAIAAGALRSYARRAKAHEERDLAGPGHTVYLGSRSSDRMMRTYANCQHPERLAPTRTELVSKAEWAELTWAQLMGKPVDEWGAVIIGAMRDFVDFEPVWWVEFCGAFERSFLRLSNWRETSVEKLKLFIEQQCAPMLAVAERLLGLRWIVEAIDKGEDRWGPRHRTLLAIGGGNVSTA